ncbi:hypothetical protein Tco_1556669 [Tanacetum coccineum]
MSNLKFAETHNLVAFLEKPKENDRFEGIIDFLNASSIRYELMVNLTIYTSCIKQFWATAKAKTVNGEVQIQALVDGKKVIVTETSVRRALQLKDVEGTECLPNATIFAELERMGAKTIAWNEFSSTMASAIILFLDKQVEGMTKHKEIYVTPSHTKKVFANMKREGKGFFGRVTPLFETMMVQAPEELEFREAGSLRYMKQVVSTAEVTTASATTTTINELTLAQTLIEIKEAKPKAVTTTTTAVTRPKARGVDNVQAMIDADYELAARLKAQEQEKLTIKERSKMFVELMDKTKKHFARLKAEEQKRKPPTKAQKRKMVQESSSKRTGEELESDNVKKQKIDENVEAKVDDEAEMKKHMEIVHDDEVAIDAIPLATKPPIIVNWKIIKEGKMGYFQIIRADGSSRRYSSMIRMLQNIDREDLETLWKLVKAKHGNIRLEEAYEKVL